MHNNLVQAAATGVIA